MKRYHNQTTHPLGTKHADKWVYRGTFLFKPPHPSSHPTEMKVVSLRSLGPLLLVTFETKSLKSPNGQGGFKDCWKLSLSICPLKDIPHCWSVHWAPLGPGRILLGVGVDGTHGLLELLMHNVSTKFFRCEQVGDEKERGLRQKTRAHLSANRISRTFWEVWCSRLI